MKLKGMLFSLKAILVCAIAVILFGMGAFAGSTVINNYRTTALINQMDVIDRALEMYSKSHVNVQKSTVKTDMETKKTSYVKTRIYPGTLTELGSVRDEQGYFSKEIDLSKFRYSTSVTDDNIMTYELGVTLPNGHYQRSRQSNK